MREFRVGDIIRCDNTGEIHEVIGCGTRDELTPLAGVKLLGNVVIVKDKDGKKWALNDWEIELVKEAK